MNLPLDVLVFRFINKTIRLVFKPSPFCWILILEVITHVPLSFLLNSSSRYPSLSYRSSKFLIGYILNFLLKLFLISVSLLSSLFINPHPPIKIVINKKLMHKSNFLECFTFSHLSVFEFFSKIMVSSYKYWVIIQISLLYYQTINTHSF